MAKKVIGGAPVMETGPDGKATQARDVTGRPLFTGGREFDFFMMPATVATDVEVTIASVATEAIMKMIGAQGADENAQAEAAAAALGSVAAALGKLGAEKTIDLMTKVFSSVQVDDQDTGQPRVVAMNHDFAGTPRLKWLVLFEALRVNFADFFPAGLSLSSVPMAPR